MLTVRFEHLGITPGDRVLDVGCGFGRHAYGVAGLKAHVVACDLAEAELKHVLDTTFAMQQENQLPKVSSINCASGDLVSLPFANQSFDKIIASEVLEHVEADDLAIHELFRVLRPGGVLAVTVPSTMAEKVCWRLSDEYHAPKAEGGHVRIYTKKELTAKLASAGFVVGRSHSAHALHSPYWWLRCWVGPNIEDNVLVQTYHKFLCWDLMKKPKITQSVERVLNPFLGKSMVLYAHKYLENVAS